MMARTVKQEATLPIDLEYEPVDEGEVEVLHCWVGEHPELRVDVWHALSWDDQKAWIEVCEEDWIEHIEAQKEAEYERILESRLEIKRGY